MLMPFLEEAFTHIEEKLQIISRGWIDYRRRRRKVSAIMLGSGFGKYSHSYEPLFQEAYVKEFIHLQSAVSSKQITYLRHRSSFETQIKFSSQTSSPLQYMPSSHKSSTFAQIDSLFLFCRLDFLLLSCHTAAFLNRLVLIE